MQIRWQIWFLISFLVCACWSLSSTMTAVGDGHEAAKANWTYSQKSGAATLAEFCRQHKIDPANNGPHLIPGGPFATGANPLFCSDSLDKAQQDYARHATTLAKKQGMRTAFIFIGSWLIVLLIAFVAGRFRKQSR